MNFSLEQATITLRHAIGSVRFRESGLMGGREREREESEMGPFKGLRHD